MKRVPALILALTMIASPSFSDDARAKANEQVNAAIAKIRRGESAVAELEELAKTIESMPERDEALSKNLEILKTMIPSKAEQEIGVTVLLPTGPWKLRWGKVSHGGISTFGSGSFGRRFAYATCTVEGGWTIGVRLVQPRYGLSEADKEKAMEPVWYLQGPTALEAGKTVKFSRCTDTVFYPAEATVATDGTLILGRGFIFPGAAKTVTYRFGKDRVVTFDLKEIAHIYRSVIGFVELGHPILEDPEKKPEITEPLPR